MRIMARLPIPQQVTIDERPQARFVLGIHDALVAVSERHVGLGLPKSPKLARRTSLWDPDMMARFKPEFWEFPVNR